MIQPSRLSLTLVLFVTLASLSAAARTQDPVVIKWSPKAGAVLKYKASVTAKGIEGVGGASEMKFGATLTRSIKEINAEGQVIVEETQDELSLMVDGQDYSSMIPFTSTTTKLTCLANGEVVARESDHPEQSGNPRLDNAMALVFSDKALNVGDTWTRKTEADNSKGLYQTVTTYNFQGVETLGSRTTYKLAVVFEETGAPTNMSASGTIWIDAADGEMVKGTYSVKNVEFGPGIIADADSVVERAD